jgi:hypothetical protein
MNILRKTSPICRCNGEDDLVGCFAGAVAKGNELTIKEVARKPARSVDRYSRGKSLGHGLLLGTVLAGSVSWSETAMTQEREYRLEYRLEAAGPATAKSAKVKFTLTNRARAPIRIAVHNTPLKGAIETRMFTIHCNNEESPLRYQGLLRSTGAPAEVVQVQGKIQGTEALKDTVLLNPDDSRHATVDLASAYSLPASGSCKIAFTSLINIIEPDGNFGGQPKYDFVKAAGEPLILPLAPAKE